jgi:hypothetical protein
MLRNLLELANGRTARWGLAGLGVLAVGGATLYFFDRDSAGSHSAMSANSDATKGTFSASGKMNPAAGKTATDWQKRVETAKLADFPALMREIMGIPDAVIRTQVAKTLVTRWVNADLTGFIAFVDATEVDDAANADDLWALLAPALASALPSLPDEVTMRPELSEIVRRLIEYSARKDPDQALVWAKQWLMDDALESALATITGEMIKKAPEKALKVFAEITTSVRRVDAISAIGAVYGTTHPVEATEWAKNLQNEAERPYAMNAVLAARAEVEPEAAGVEFTDFRSKMVSSYATEREAEIARMGIPDIRQYAPGEPLSEDDAMNSEVLPGRDNPQLGLIADAARAIAENWGETDPQAALKWTESLPPGGLRDDVVGSALVGWASKDPQAASAYYLKNSASNPTPAEPIFEAWAQAEPARAAEQAAELSDAAVREKAISGVVSGWLDSSADQTAIAAWVDKLPGKAERDAANAQIADAESFDEPDAAWQRATGIRNQATRRDALRSAFASLVASDPEQARVMLAETKDLTPDETTRLTRMLKAVSPKASN